MEIIEEKPIKEISRDIRKTVYKIAHHAAADI